MGTALRGQEGALSPVRRAAIATVAEHSSAVATPQQRIVADAITDQDAVVSGIRQRTGTLLAAHALVASFLGPTTVKAKGLHGFSWAALVVLLLGLVIAALLLSNWKLRFAIDAPDF